MNGNQGERTRLFRGPKDIRLITAVGRILPQRIPAKIIPKLSLIVENKYINQSIFVDF